MPQINVELHREEDQQRLRDTFGKSDRENGRRAIEAYLALRSAWETGIKDPANKVFTRSELSFLVEIQRQTGFSAQFAFSSRQWIALVEDASRYQDTVEAQGDDVSVLSEKISEMHPADIFFYREEIYRLNESPTPDLESFLDKFARKGGADG